MAIVLKFENLFETESLINEKLYANLHKRLETLGKKTKSFYTSNRKEMKYTVYPAPSNQYPVTSI